MFMEAKPDFTFHKVKTKCEKATKIKEKFPRRFDVNE